MSEPRSPHQTGPWTESKSSPWEHGTCQEVSPLSCSPQGEDCPATPVNGDLRLTSQDDLLMSLLVPSTCEIPHCQPRFCVCKQAWRCLRLAATRAVPTVRPQVSGHSKAAVWLLSPFLPLNSLSQTRGSYPIRPFQERRYK